MGYLRAKVAKAFLKEQYRTKKSTSVLISETALLTRFNENGAHRADIRNASEWE